MKNETRKKLVTGFLITGLSVSCLKFFGEHIDILLCRQADDIFCLEQNIKYQESFSNSEEYLNFLETKLNRAPETVANYQGNREEGYFKSVLGYVKQYKDPKLERLALQILDEIYANPNFSFEDKEAYASVIPMHIDAYCLDRTYHLQSVGRYLKKQPGDYEDFVLEIKEQYPTLKDEFVKKWAWKKTQEQAISTAALKEDACGRKSILPLLEQGITDIKKEEYLSQELIVRKDSSQAAIMTKMLYEVVDPAVVERARRYHEEEVLVKELYRLFPKKQLAEDCVQFFDRKQPLTMEEFQDFYENYIGVYYQEKYGVPIQVSPIMTAYYQQARQPKEADVFPLVFKNYFAKQQGKPTVELVQRTYFTSLAVDECTNVSLTEEEYRQCQAAYERILLGNGTDQDFQLTHIWNISQAKEGVGVIHETTNIYGKQAMSPLSVIGERTMMVKTLGAIQK